MENSEEASVGWIKRFIFFHGKRHPADMGEAEIGHFLSSLACDSHVAASTQHQALNALLFLAPPGFVWVRQPEVTRRWDTPAAGDAPVERIRRAVAAREAQGGGAR